MIKNVYYHPGFKRALKKLEVSKRTEFEKNLELFIRNPFNPKLNTHKLRGKLKNLWSFSITHSDRVVFEFLNKEFVGFIDIGSHDVYR
ncbi:MAG: type II toxin-antitoxin system mRNA interferase toxin, RelE/StbE family [Candidatus Woykebacteria bacterium]